MIPRVSRRLRCSLVFACLVAFALTTTARSAAAPKAAAKSAGYAARDDVRAFISEMVGEHGFDRAALSEVFRGARFQRSIVVAMDRPLLEPPKWHTYSRSFLAPERVAAGVAYWHEYRHDLARAEERYGVPAEVIVAILGVETFYGRLVGNYRVLDALATLAFDYPRRAAFFRGELKQFLLLSRELGMPPFAAKGSFAGAMGVPQFMPGSYRSYAVDFDGSGRPDLLDAARRTSWAASRVISRGTTGKRGSPCSSRRRSRRTGATRCCASSTAASPSAGRPMRGRPTA